MRLTNFLAIAFALPLCACSNHLLTGAALSDQTRTAQSTNSAVTSTVVVLPPSINPQGKSYYLPHGTRVFANHFSVVSYEDSVGGVITRRDVPIADDAVIVRGPNGLIVTRAGRPVETFPASATVRQNAAISLEFYPPDRKLPPSLLGRTPDYVVP